MIYPARSQFHKVEESIPSLCSVSLRVNVRGLSSSAVIGAVLRAISENSCRRSSRLTVTLMPLVFRNNSSIDIRRSI
ncbi:hypothetical protein [Coprobacter fastidiosus]|uniref:hypothetical protein n=1 Tax=Coprobacter fastidiosus TaxID=1099853 RepID=UPI003AB749F6